MSMKQIHIGSAYLGPKTRFSKPNYQYIIVFKKYIYENDENNKKKYKEVAKIHMWCIPCEHNMCTHHGHNPPMSQSLRIDQDAIRVLRLTGVEDYGEAMLRISRRPEIHPRSTHSNQGCTKTHGHQHPSLFVHLHAL